MSSSDRYEWIYLAAFGVLVFAIVLAISIWAVSSAISYANCEYDPTTPRCVALHHPHEETGLPCTGLGCL